MATCTTSVDHFDTKVVQHEMTSVGTYQNPTMCVGIEVLPQGTPVGIGSWKMKQDLVVELRIEGAKFIALYHDVSEYGIGETEQDALSDLLTSLADYRLSLERREATLAAREKNDLSRLKELIG
jgi:hypothetical protein